MTHRRPVGLWMSLTLSVVLAGCAVPGVGTTHRAPSREHMVAAAKTFERQGEQEKALRLYAQVLQQDPNFPAARKRVEAIMLANRQSPGPETLPMMAREPAAIASEWNQGPAVADAGLSPSHSLHPPLVPPGRTAPLPNPPAASPVLAIVSPEESSSRSAVSTTATRPQPADAEQWSMPIVTQGQPVEFSSFSSDQVVPETSDATEWSLPIIRTPGAAATVPADPS